jgi:mono/diheme cytochrome c family protein
MALLCLVIGTLTVAGTLTSVGAAEQEQPKKDLLPDAPGKAVVSQKCTQCHDAARFALRRRSEDEWDQVITQMQSNGLSLTDEEYDIVLNYLSKNLGPTAAPRNNDHD